MNSSHQINIERALLSSIFFEPDIFEDVLGVLKSSDFYLVEHQKIFKAMEDLLANHQMRHKKVYSPFCSLQIAASWW